MKNMIISSLIIALLLAISLNISARGPLTFEERVKAQEAIEKVFYNHRIWPQENPQPKPSFEKMVPKESIEAKVTEYLTTCAALDKYWQRPIESGQLQAEMDRMAKQSKDPATLNELFAALNNDPYLIAECLARPILADRLGSNWYANDERFHGELKAKAEDVLNTLTADNFCSTADGEYGILRFKLADDSDVVDDHQSIAVSEEELKNISSMIPEEGGISAVIEHDDCLIIYHTLLKNDVELEYEALVFNKTSFEAWLENLNIIPELPGVSTTSYCLPQTQTFTCDEQGWWSTISSLNSPGGRVENNTVWTGAEMIVWGGYNAHNPEPITGGRYYPATDSWLATSTGTNCPSPRRWCKAVWTGAEMIIWGGASSIDVLTNTGGRYNPVSDSWLSTSLGANCPESRDDHSAIWTGTEMIVWGGSILPYMECEVNTGGRYNPSADSWLPTSIGVNCPSVRALHTAVWTGNEMIVWAGHSINGDKNTGGRYNPLTDSWLPTSTGANVPNPRRYFSTVWTGTEMIIWGGVDSWGGGLRNTGGRYNPSTDSWTPTSTGLNVPCRRQVHSAVWTGIEMIIWGGDNYPSLFNSGGRYNPSSDSWIKTSEGANLPTVRYGHADVWTGKEMIIWGGHNFSGFQNNGGIYSFPSSPLGLSNNTATDISGCSDGILIEWAAPSSWGDGGSGTRSFDVLRDGSAIDSDLPETTLSYTDTTGNNDVSYLYQVKANNGCGFSTTTTGASAVDINGSPIVQPVITKIVDKSRITRGLVIYYIPGSPAQRHDLYKDGALAVSGFVSGATYIPGDSLSHAYQIITILNECSLLSNTVNAVDNAATNPPR